MAGRPRLLGGASGRPHSSSVGAEVDGTCLKTSKAAPGASTNATDVLERTPNVVSQRTTGALLGGSSSAFGSRSSSKGLKSTASYGNLVRSLTHELNDLTEANDAPEVPAEKEAASAATPTRSLSPLSSYLRRLENQYGSDVKTLRTAMDGRPVSKNLWLEEVPALRFPSLRRELVGFVSHRGTLDAGHYIAYVRDLAFPNIWFRCDDEDVDIVTEGVIRTCGKYVYCAFYE